MKKSYLIIIICLAILFLVKDYIIPVAIVIFFILIMFSLFNKIKLYYKIKDIPISKIKSANQGIVALHGSLVNENNQVFESPVGGESCNYWKLEISEISKPKRNNNNSRQKQISLSLSCNFLKLIDGTDSCYVSIQNPDWKIEERTYTKKGSELNELDFGNKVKNFVSATNYLIVESWVPVENSTYVIGNFASMPSNTSPFESTWINRTKRNNLPDSIWYKIADFTSTFFQSEMDKFLKIWEIEMKNLEGISSNESLRGTKMVHWISRSDDCLRPSPFFISSFPLKNIPKALAKGLIKNVIFICIYLALTLIFFYWKYPTLFTNL